ncbi:hypothetical protein [Pseudomonas chlororaphis]|uniref:hypothetical protein n=1 Tax=Pseudomonas chlororaphis TaxID=587753 RepID=UPI0037C6A84A
MFNGYLDDKDCYLRLERYFYDFFCLEIQANGIDVGKFKMPFYNTTFSNGIPFMDGNPIFSAKNEVNGQILRAVLDEDTHQFTSYHDKNLGCEFVIVGNLELLDNIKKQISEWIRAQ